MIGRTVSQYNIVEELGRGGIGVAYKAGDAKLKCTIYEINGAEGQTIISMVYLEGESLNEPLGVYMDSVALRITQPSISRAPERTE